MVRLATSVLAASLLAIPALAASSEQYERSVAESDLYGRDFLDVEDAMVAREQLEELFGRELVNDMEERSPFGLGLLFKGIKAVAKIGHKAHSAHDHAQNFQNNRQHRREFDDEEFDLRDFDEDLEVREPGKFGAAFRVAKTLVHKHGHHAQNLAQFIPQNNDQNQRREFDEELDARDFDDDLEAREPGRFGAVFRAAKGFMHKHGHHAQNMGQSMQQGNDQSQRREFDEELDARDFDEDLEAREPGRFGAVFRAAKGFMHKHGHHAQNMGQSMQQSNDQNQRREFDELEDLLEREYYDELD